MPKWVRKEEKKLSFWNGQLVLWSHQQANARLVKYGFPSDMLESFFLRCCAGCNALCNGSLLPPATLYFGKYIHVGVRRCYCAKCETDCTVHRTSDLQLMLSASVYGVAPIVIDAFLVPSSCGKRVDVVFVTMAMLPVDEVILEPGEAVAAVVKAVNTLHRSAKATLGGAISPQSVKANPFTGRVVFMDWTLARELNKDDVARDKVDALWVCRDIANHMEAYDHPIMFVSNYTESLFDSLC